MAKETINTTNKFILPSSEDAWSDEARKQIVENLQKITPEQARAVGEELEKKQKEGKQKDAEENTGENPPSGTVGEQNSRVLKGRTLPEAWGTMLGSNNLLHWRIMQPLSHYPFLFPPTLQRTGAAFSHSHWASPTIPVKWPKVQSAAKQQHMTNTKFTSIR